MSPMMKNDTEEPQESTYLGGCIKKVDELIKKGGASVEDLQELKMDLEDASSGEVEEESGEDMMSPEDEKGNMSGLIIRIQNKGRGK